MADKVTASSKKKGTTDPNERVEELLEELREAMIDAGKDEGTVDAILFAAQPDQVNVVGNLADLQRMGARVVDGSSGGQAVEEAVVVSSVSEDGTATQVQASSGEPVQTGRPPSAAATARAEADAEAAQAAAEKDSAARAEAAEKKAAADKEA